MFTKEAGDNEEEMMRLHLDLVCYSPWGHKESDMTEQLNWTELETRNYMGKK